MHCPQNTLLKAKKRNKAPFSSSVKQVPEIETLVFMLQLAVASENIAELSKSLTIVNSEVDKLGKDGESSGICDSFSVLMQSSQLSMDAAVSELRVRTTLSDDATC